MSTEAAPFPLMLDTRLRDELIERLHRRPFTGQVTLNLHNGHVAAVEIRETVKPPKEDRAHA